MWQGDTIGVVQDLFAQVPNINVVRDGNLTGGNGGKEGGLTTTIGPNEPDQKGKGVGNVHVHDMP